MQINNWIEKNNSLKRQAIAFSLSTIIVLAILMIPIAKHTILFEEEALISVELSKLKSVEKSIIEKPIKKKNFPVKTVLESKTIPREMKQIEKKEVITKPNPMTDNKPTVINKFKVFPSDKKLPSSGVILNTLLGEDKLFELSKEFKKNPDYQYEFIAKKVKPPKWSIERKLIDEDVDKPETYMEFYSDGIVGLVERFFDEISYNKEFTTKYGTKISCGGIGPLVTCSWK